MVSVGYILIFTHARCEKSHGGLLATFTMKQFLIDGIQIIRIYNGCLHYEIYRICACNVFYVISQCTGKKSNVTGPTLRR